MVLILSWYRDVVLYTLCVCVPFFLLIGRAMWHRASTTIENLTKRTRHWNEMYICRTTAVELINVKQILELFGLFIKWTFNWSDKWMGKEKKKIYDAQKLCWFRHLLQKKKINFHHASFCHGRVSVCGGWGFFFFVFGSDWHIQNSKVFLILFRFFFIVNKITNRKPKVDELVDAMKSKDCFLKILMNNCSVSFFYFFFCDELTHVIVTNETSEE